MNNTGFSAVRATRHDALVKRLTARLTERGYKAQELSVEGDRPDIRILDRDGRTAYVDMKTTYSGQRCISIKRGSFDAAFSLTLQGTPVYIISLHDKKAFVDTVYTYTARLIDGPRRPSGNGSATDWLLARPGGTPFDEFFPSRVDAPEPVEPRFGEETHPDTFKLPTEQQAKDYTQTGRFTPDASGWSS